MVPEIRQPLPTLVQVQTSEHLILHRVQPLNFNGIEFNITAGPGDTVDFTLDQPEKKNIAVTLDEFFGALNNANISDAGYKEALNDAIIGIDNGMVELANANSSLGGRMNVANSVFESNLDLEIAQYVSTFQNRRCGLC